MHLHHTIRENSVLARSSLRYFDAHDDIEPGARRSGIFFSYHNNSGCCTRNNIETSIYGRIFYTAILKSKHSEYSITRISLSFTAARDAAGIKIPLRKRIVSGVIGDAIGKRRSRARH